MMNFKQQSLWLIGLKIALLSVVALVIIELIKLCYEQILYVVNEQKITLVEYLWMEPFHFDKDSLSSLVSEQLTFTEAGLMIIIFGFMMISTVLIVIIMLIVRVQTIAKNILKGEQFQDIVDAISGGLCWVLAWGTINSLNHSWSIQLFIQEQFLKHIENGSYIFGLFFTISFICSTLYLVKSIYLAIYKNINPMSKYMTNKALGN